MYKPVLFTVIFSGLLAIFIISCDDAGITVKTENYTIKLSDSTGQDAYITDFYPNTNFKNDGDFGGIAWITNDTGYIGRTLFRFDLTAIPQSATVKSAKLILTYNQSPTHYGSAGHHQDSGSNACYLQRILQQWEDSSVTWNNQPQVTAANQVMVEASTSNFQNYSIDVTDVVNDMVKNPTENFGFLFRLQTESPIRVLGFSSGNTDSTLRPVLDITYKFTP